MKNSKHLFYSLLTFALATISLPSCGSDEDEPERPSLTDGYVGEFAGQLTLNIAGQYDYDTDIKILISAGKNETLSVTFPEYSMSNTMMGEITMGAITLENLTYDSLKVGFYLNYGEAGKNQYFKAERNGTVTMDSEYPLNAPSDILVTKGEDGKITVVNSFRIGTMPMPITATFIGWK
ncbi:MAG: hypothetical protein J1F20_07850 [Muribaculaceae bacterium]|nr:hypothetical protein [Muribaculaceae bacterium]